MIKFERVQSEVNRIKSITCDSCKISFNPLDYEATEFLHINQVTGYGSIFGDSNRIKIDLCQHCVKKRLGDVVRVLTHDQE